MQNLIPTMPSIHGLPAALTVTLTVMLAAFPTSGARAPLPQSSGGAIIILFQVQFEYLGNTIIVGLNATSAHGAAHRSRTHMPCRAFSPCRAFPPSPRQGSLPLPMPRLTLLRRPSPPAEPFSPCGGLSPRRTLLPCRAPPLPLSRPSLSTAPVSPCSTFETNVRVHRQAMWRADCQVRPL